VRPIIINLLAEDQQTAQARARDPVKVFIAISTGLLAVVVAVGGALSGLALRNQLEIKNLERQRQTLESQQTTRNIGAYRSCKQWADDLIEINQSRRLCAPQLALIKNVVPDYVQLDRLSLVTTTVAAAPASPPAEDGGDLKAKIAERTPSASQVVTLQLEGKVISARPEEDVANFRHTLESAAQFSGQIQAVQLRSYGRLADPTERGGSAVGQFVIDCQYKEHSP